MYEKGKTIKPDSPIDWTNVHARVREMEAGLESNFKLPPEKIKEQLKKRALALAAEKSSESCVEESIRVVEFLLAGERYGIETAFLKEVYPLRDITPLPGIPAFVLGIINVRGQILSVIDIKKFFKMPDKGLSDLNKVIIAQKKGMELGILADAIMGEREVKVFDLQTTMPAFTGIRAEYLRGVTQDRFIILDMEHILDDPNIIVDGKDYKGGS
ncbi:MAG: chemotaxis protein CheW [Spirochaetota bacterium]